MAFPAATIVAGVFGAWRLARRDPRGLAWFQTTPQGFWTSFWGPGLVFPAFLALQALDGGFEDGPLRPLLVHLIAYVAACAAFPLAVAHIAEGLDKGRHYIRYIVAYNWSAVIQLAVLLPVVLLSHLFPGPAFAMLNLAVTVVLLVYQTYIAHVALEVPPIQAGMLVVLDLMIGAMVQMTADRLLG
ncbi:hypothetical protein [Magnetospirillum sp. SS-4]|uniref:hypothetical protein n=1 Tax=Magnetospirillum sp. SS-4 TaxID=2681465 RepID=UPI00137D70D8|nr:hypothetical protein [Magnetospirillum sp. SS-4]CAA7621391.1 conserved membrane hypothetical protein [Magnetospirillum sp. SS-4]